MHIPAELRFEAFGASDTLTALGPSRQVGYLRRYLDDLGAATILVEPNYFDKDYLAEFAAFYCSSSAGYPNVCQRLHFFDQQIDKSVFTSALSGSLEDQTRLQSSYLGFVIVRPIPLSSLGRTVLKWYPDRSAHSVPRVVAPSRDYHCHVAGMRLTVSGLAWQQQDTAVGKCATIALWSMLHSSALDGHHAMPTTASVTRAAHRTASLGSRVFPSGGLNILQLCEAIKEHGLSPVVIPGDLPQQGQQAAFTRERFSGSCSALIRSGFPVILIGNLVGVGLHATCAVGFRSAAPPSAPPGNVVHHDSDIPVMYVHDDNLGPNVRLSIGTNPGGAVFLKPEAPVPIKPTMLPDTTTSYPEFVPSNLVVAVPDDLRTSPDALHVVGLNAALELSRIFDEIAKTNAIAALPGLTLSTRFSRLRDYLFRDLGQALAANGALLAKARLELTERIPPMSLHLGIVRIGEGSRPLFDVLYDTTDSDRYQPVFAHVVFAPGIGPLIAALRGTGELKQSLGYLVDASA